MLTQKHLISGLPPDQRDDLGERFVSALAAKYPALGAEEMAAAAAATTTAAATADSVAAGGSTGVGRSVHAGKRPGGVSKRPRLWEKLKEGVSSGENGSAGDRAAGDGTGCAMVGAKGGAGGRGGTGLGADSGGGFSFGFSFA